MANPLIVHLLSLRVSERNFESFRFDRSSDANFNVESRRARTPADSLWKKAAPATCGDSLDRDLLLAPACTHLFDL